MQFIKKIKFTFLGVVLSILLPLITIIIVFMALYNYNIAHKTILDGFNKKLLAISSVTSSFIDGDEHQTIAIAKQMEVFTYDQNASILYAISIDSMVNRINTQKGAAITINGFDKDKLNQYIIYDITIDSAKNLLYAVTYTKEILSLNLETKEIEVIKILDFIAKGIAYADGTFYLSSDNSIYTLDIDNEPLLLKRLKSINALSLLDGKLYGINEEKGIAYKDGTFYLSSDHSIYTLDIENEPLLLKKYLKSINTLSLFDGKLYGINEENRNIFYIDIKTLEYYDNIAKNFPLENGSIHHLAVSKEYFYTGSHNLIAYERNSSKTFQDDFARQYRDETSALYLKYIKPMSDIKVALNLSYHYTFNLLYGDSENNCFYILDVNEGSEYTPIGSYDNMDIKDLMGAENIVLRDGAYISGIKLWDKWGLLKVAYSGIKDKSGKVVSLAGADIDISIINSKTKEAFVQSIIIGMLALIIGILASYYIARKIIRPIEVLKASALKIAAGNYGDSISIKSPKELHQLSGDFNYMSKELESTLNSGSKQNSNYKDNKYSNRLNKLFEFNSSHIKVDGMIESKNLIGIVESVDSIYIYSIDEVFNSSMEANKRKIIINDILERYIHNNSIFDFIEIFNPVELISIDIDSLDKISTIKQEKYSNNLDKTTTINKSRKLIIKDIEISIILNKEK